MRAAAGFERLTSVQPAMFEDISGEELAKYDKYLQELAEMKKSQEQLLQDIRVNWDRHSPVAAILIRWTIG
jgi:programmed cell death 6-interacting protein